MIDAQVHDEDVHKSIVFRLESILHSFNKLQSILRLIRRRVGHLLQVIDEIIDNLRRWSDRQDCCVIILKRLNPANRQIFIANQQTVIVDLLKLDA